MLPLPNNDCSQLCKITSGVHRILVTSPPLNSYSSKDQSGRTYLKCTNMSVANLYERNLVLKYKKI